MAELKTKPTAQSAAEFLLSQPDPARREDCLALLALFQETLGMEPKMWGGAIIGFGDVHLKYESGRELDWFVTGFSPRKQNLTLYLHLGSDHHADLLARLGKHKTGKGCLYINRLSDVDLDVLRELIKAQKV